VRREDAGRARREAERRNTIVNELMRKELRLRRRIYRDVRRKGTSVRVSDARSVSLSFLARAEEGVQGWLYLKWFEVTSNAGRMFLDV
jgi:hypothetical protein